MHPYSPPNGELLIEGRGVCARSESMHISLRRRSFLSVRARSLLPLPLKRISRN